MWPITQPGAVQKPDAVTVCNKGEGCAKMTTVQDGPGATFSCLPMSQVQTPPAPCLPQQVLSPTATLLERTLPAQGFMGTSKAAFPRRLRPQNRDSTWANLVNALK